MAAAGVILFLLMLIFAVFVIAPVVIYTVSRVVPRVVDRSLAPIVDRISPELEGRLSRIEEAIDAMAGEIERMRERELNGPPASPQLPGTEREAQGASD